MCVHFQAVMLAC